MMDYIFKKREAKKEGRKKWKEEGRKEGKENIVSEKMWRNRNAVAFLVGV